MHDRLNLSRATPILTIPGGLRAVAEAMGEDPKNTAAVRLALDAAQRFIALDPESGAELHGLLTWGVRGEEAHGRQREVFIAPTPEVFLGGGRGKLVPVPRQLPRLIGRGNDWTPQASLQLLAMEELRRLAPELVEAGGVLIPRRRWEDLAEVAGLSKRLLRELLDRAWLEAGPSAEGRVEAPAFLYRLDDGDRWTLANAYSAELAELREGAGYDLAAADRGRRSGAARRARAGQAVARRTRRKSP